MENLPKDILTEIILKTYDFNELEVDEIKKIHETCENSLKKKKDIYIFDKIFLNTVSKETLLKILSFNFDNLDTDYIIEIKRIAGQNIAKRHREYKEYLFKSQFVDEILIYYSANSNVIVFKNMNAFLCIKFVHEKLSLDIGIDCYKNNNHYNNLTVEDVLDKMNYLKKSYDDEKVERIKKVAFNFIKSYRTLEKAKIPVR
jgi:hypothetical protein